MGMNDSYFDMIDSTFTANYSPNFSPNALILKCQYYKSLSSYAASDRVLHPKLWNNSFAFLRAKGA